MGFDCIHIDKNVNFNFHIDFLSKKISRAVGAFKFVCRNIPFKTRKMLYNSFILPHFKCLNSLWCNASQQNINSLQLLQNRAMRVIVRCHSSIYIDDMLKKLRFLNISQMYYFDTCVLMHKIKHGLVPCYLNFDDNLDYYHNYNYVTFKELV